MPDTIILSVDRNKVFDAVQAMGFAALGERLVGLMLAEPSMIDRVGLLGVYGIEVVDTTEVAPASDAAAAKLSRLGAARRKVLDTTLEYNTRRTQMAVAPFSWERGNADAEFRAMSGAKSEFIKIAQEIADTVLPPEDAK